MKFKITSMITGYGNMKVSGILACWWGTKLSVFWRVFVRTYFLIREVKFVDDDGIDMIVGQEVICNQR